MADTLYILEEERKGAFVVSKVFSSKEKAEEYADACVLTEYDIIPCELDPTPSFEEKTYLVKIYYGSPEGYVFFREEECVYHKDVIHVIQGRETVQWYPVGYSSILLLRIKAKSSNEAKGIARERCREVGKNEEEMYPELFEKRGNNYYPETAVYDYASKEVLCYASIDHEY